MTAAAREMLEKKKEKKVQGIFVLYTDDLKGRVIAKERALVLGVSTAMPRLINGLIKKSNQLYEAYTVCHSVIPLPQIVLLL